jgi:hypothetical protein
MAGLTKQDIKYYLSTHESSGVPYLGGARDEEDEVSDNFLHSLFDKVSKEHAESGITKFRCIYVYNSNKTEWLKNPIVIIPANTESPNDDAAVGWGSSKIGPNLDGDSVEQELLDQHTPPDGVHFFNGNIRKYGAVLGADIGPEMGKALWFRVKVDNNAGPFRYNKFTIRLLADNLKVDDPDIDTNPTGSPIPPIITFPIFGEFGDLKWIKELLDKIFKRNPNFYVTLGNNTPSGNGSSWLSLFDRVMPRLTMAFGAQDIITPSLANQYINKIAPAKFVPNIINRYYSKDVGNIHNLYMDTSGYSKYDASSKQYEFVVNDLRRAFTNQKIDWIIVHTHKAMYASNTSTATRYLYGDLRDLYHPIFTEYGVTAVFQGSMRNYQRSKVLQYNEGSPTNPVAFDYDYVENEPPQPGDRTYTITSGKGFPDGQIYFMCGTAGAGHDVIDSPASYTLKYNHIDYGYLWPIVDNTNPDVKKLEIRFYNRFEQLKDYMTILKPKPVEEEEDAGTDE